MTPLGFPVVPDYNTETRQTTSVTYSNNKFSRSLGQDKQSNNHVSNCRAPCWPPVTLACLQPWSCSINYNVAMTFINNNNNNNTKYQVPSTSARQLRSDLGRRLTDISGESRKTSYLFQRFSVLVQRFNAVLLHDSLPDYDCTDY